MNFVILKHLQNDNGILNYQSYCNINFSFITVMRTSVKLATNSVWSLLKFKMQGSINNYIEHPRNSFHSDETSYQKAIKALNSLKSNKEELSDPVSCQHPEFKFRKINEFFVKCGLDKETIGKKLSIIHVSGTKGKGSTCAYCESILRQYGYKTGLFTSPHFISVRERIRINGHSITDKKFSDYFWETYRKLCTHDNYKNAPEMPPYFTFLTIMAFKVFIEEKVDVAIIEVGIGGEYDSTNVIQNTAVVGITSLAYDHVNLLGKTIEEIAWQKAGIMKSNCIALTVCDQPPDAMKTLRTRALEKKCSLFVVPNLKQYFTMNHLSLGISSPVQFQNASLGAQLANAWLNPQYYKQIHVLSHAPSFPLTDEIRFGLRCCRWPGRTQQIFYTDKLKFYLDGAHDVGSIQNCIQWYLECIPPMSKKVLVFNMTGNRDGHRLMEYLIPCQFDRAYFCPNIIDSENNLSLEFTYQNEKDQQQEYECSKKYFSQWLKMNKQPESRTKLFKTVNEILKYLEQDTQNEPQHILVTGSLHLVGAFLALLDPELSHKFSA